MATPSTVATWTLNGSATEFDVPFDYLSRTFVKVTLIGATSTVLTLGTDYQFITPTRIRTFAAYGPPTYNLIEIRRETSTTDRLVEFHDASILTASDMNTADLQVLHVAEEARNAATETIGVNNDGELDARGRRIVNLATPRLGTNDAVSMSFYQGDVNGAFQAKVAAEAARDAAKASQTAAASSASAANTSRTQAAASATAAAGSASTASTKASEASASAAAAATSKSDSAASAILSQQWAVNPENSVVSGGLYSSYHWAMKSKGWAEAAASGVLPDGSVTWSKLVEFMKGNMHPDPFVLTLGDWTSSAPVIIASGNANGNGAGLIITAPQSTGTPFAYGGECATPRIRVLAGMRIQFVANHLTQDASGSGEVGLYLSWYRRDGTLLASNRVVNNRPAFQDFETNIQAIVPVEAHYLRIRWRFNYDSAGNLKVSTVVYRQMVLHAGWGEVTDGLNTRLTTAEGTITAQGTRLSTAESGITSLNGKTDATNGRVSTLEAVKPVLKVNNTAPDANGNVALAMPSGGVALDCYGTVGEIAILARQSTSGISAGAVVAGSTLYRYNRGAGADSVGSTSSAVGGTWRFLGNGLGGTTRTDGNWGLYQRIA